MKFIFYVAVLTALIMYQIICDASSQGTVNIITRYNYLRSPEILSAVKNECGVEISYDEYYSDGECLRRISTSKDFYFYDIVVFPSDIYELVKKKIERKNSSLNEVVKWYYSYFKDRYLAHNYSPNVVYFMVSLSGFVWNPEIIKISPEDSISSMFDKAKNNIVILKDSFTGVWNLIDNQQRLPIGSLADVFGKITQGVDIYITNGYNVLYSKDRFAFAFLRSGEAIIAIKAAKNKNLTFLVHPKLSYISSDLMAELNARSETRCVARLLASKKILDIVQKDVSNVSPYGTYKSVRDPVFQAVYRTLFSPGYNVRWLDSFFAKDAKEFVDIRYMWDNIHLLPQVKNGNHKNK